MLKSKVTLTMNEVLVYHKGCHLLNLQSVAERKRTKCLAVSVAHQIIREHVLQKSSINKSKTNAIIFKNQHFSKLKQAKPKKKKTPDLDTKWKRIMGNYV